MANAIMVVRLFKDLKEDPFGLKYSPPGCRGDERLPLCPNLCWFLDGFVTDDDSEVCVSDWRDHNPWFGIMLDGPVRWEDVCAFAESMATQLISGLRKRFPRAEIKVVAAFLCLDPCQYRSAFFTRDIGDSLKLRHVHNFKVLKEHFWPRPNGNYDPTTVLGRMFWYPKQLVEACKRWASVRYNAYHAHAGTVNTLYDEFMAVLDDEFMKCKRIMRKMIVDWGDNQYNKKAGVADMWAGYLQTESKKLQTSLPHIFSLLCVMLTMPIQTATVERGFSTHRVIKDRLSNRMGIKMLDSKMRVRMLMPRPKTAKFGSKNFKDLSIFEPIVNQTANMMMKARDCVFPQHPGPPALMAKVHSDVHQICFPDDDEEE